MEKSILIKRILACDLIVFFIGIDQLFKWWAIELYFRPQIYGKEAESLSFFDWLSPEAQDRFPFVRFEITSFFNMVMVWNEGVSFGMLATGHDFMPYVLIGFAILLSSIFFVWMWRSTHWIQILSLSLVIAGALSNVWDRVRFGAVADFYDFHAFGFHYPAFNIADSCIVIGVAVLALDTLWCEPRRIKLMNKD
jgi:signal peptidase II